MQTGLKRLGLETYDKGFILALIKNCKTECTLFPSTFKVSLVLMNLPLKTKLLFAQKASNDKIKTGH